MSEAKLWGKLKRAVGIHYPNFRMSRHECALTKGTPDVSFATDRLNGWIELKYLPKAPAKPTTVPLASKLAREQAQFLSSRPNTWILAEIGGERGAFYLFKGSDGELLRSMPYGEWGMKAKVCWREFNVHEFCAILSGL